MGLPNTPQLIEGVLELAGRHNVWGQSVKLPDRLRGAFEFFYPDAEHEGFRPDVVDFMSALRTFLDVGAGLPGTAFKDAPELFRSLKFAIAHLLIERLRACDDKLGDPGHPYLDSVVQPGNIVITSNWDLIIERYAALKEVPIRLSGHGERPSELTLLKLHGSIDWCLAAHAQRQRTKEEYASLTERMFSERPYTPAVPKRDSAILRIRGLEQWNEAWRKVKSRATELHMVTMARGKAGDLGPLREIWRDAYAAISRAEQLEICGYSMPPDDIEIRTLLRAGTLRGEGPTEIAIRNPAPDVHVRFRSYLERTVKSDFIPIDAVG